MPGRNRTTNEKKSKTNEKQPAEMRKHKKKSSPSRDEEKQPAEMRKHRKKSSPSSDEEKEDRAAYKKLKKTGQLDPFIGFWVCIANRGEIISKSLVKEEVIEKAYEYDGVVYITRVGHEKEDYDTV